MKIILSRLDLGHTHYDPDQHHAVFNQSVRGITGGRQRKDVHSLGICIRTHTYTRIRVTRPHTRARTAMYEQHARKAHSDLLHFVELGKLHNFDEWLAPMKCRLEEGIQVIF